MTLVQQQSSIADNRSLLSERLQQLARFDNRDRNSQSLLSPDTADLILKIENALVELQVERIYQIAIASSLWDFYPTPAPVIEKMLELAQIRPSMKVLEPSAGIGNLCLQLRKLGVEPSCFEISPLLQQGLLLQKFNLIGSNFLNPAPTAVYDRVIANPPFSKNGVARHTFRAFDWLRPGGRLITVAHHYRLTPSPTDRAFFNWLQGIGARFYDCGRAFEKNERPCNIPIQIIVIDKPKW